VAEGVHFTRRAIAGDLESALDRVEAALPYPVFCKPANMGSSVGVGKASDRAGLAAALTEAARWDRRVLVERGIDAREIEISVLGNDAPEASIAGEIVPCNEFYDFEAKYVDDDSDLLIPAPISDALMTRLRRVAVDAFLAIDGAGLARVDFLLERGTETFYLNEINTLPGFTPISMYPKLWEATGLAYPALVDRLIDLAMARHVEKRGSETVFRSKE
jgi:D-alanine-D-alanine ligase